MMRAYAAVALDNPKCLANLGGALRAAQCYGASLIVIGGPRMERLKKLATDTMSAYRHIPTLQVPDVMDCIPHDCIPIAVEKIEGARSLFSFTHPERAYYILGPEDGSLGKRVLDRCPLKVMVPMEYCMNLAATVNVLLYDRAAKQSRA